MIDSSKNIPIRNALISVYHKEGLEPVVEQLVKNGVHLYATGGTLAYLQELGANPMAVEDFTGHPSVLGGRVKTLHPKIFGGILARRDNPQDKSKKWACKRSKSSLSCGLSRRAKMPPKIFGCNVFTRPPKTDGWP
ncbi:MAG TPA: hypothetical protein GXX61_01340, partial [Bacteroidales bacterium]|nr:hypothetical protein [Bacteroidales bacterium]